jgi:hypothetical protein
LIGAGSADGSPVVCSLEAAAAPSAAASAVLRPSFDDLTSLSASAASHAAKAIANRMLTIISSGVLPHLDEAVL